MNGDTIRDFMVALGFSTDNVGAKRMGDTLEGVEKKAKTLNTVLLGLATGAVIAVTKTASELDKLYYSSQRIGASASNIRGFEAALTQMGGSASNALQTLESLAQKIRQSPGYEGMVNNLGVSTRDQNGAMRDRVEVMKDMSKTLAGMDYYQANAYGSAMGIDETTLMAMRDPAFLQNMEKYQKLQKEMGMSDDLAKSGKDFMVQFRDVTMTTKALAEVILMTAGKALIPVLNIINMGLQGAIKWFSGLNPEIKGFLAAGLKIGMLILIFGGLFAAISKLAKLTIILKGLLFVFRALNLAILASPIGIVLALAAAIALLYDDYQTWKAGGKSLIDWGEWAPGIETAISKIKELTGVIMEMFASFASNPAETAKGMFNSLSRMMGGGDVFAETPATLNPSAAPQPAPTAPPKQPVTPVGNLNQLASNAFSGIKNFVTDAAKGLGDAMGVGSVTNAVRQSNKILTLIATEGTKRIYQMGDGATETRTGGTVAWRNNNPGNLKFEFQGSADKSVKSKRTKEKALSDARKRYAGVVALDQWGNAVFETIEAGAVAKAKLLKQQHSGKTIPEMLRGYAKDDYSGKTNYAAYEATINRTATSKGLNLKGKKIGEMSQAEFAALAEGMVNAEGVKEGKVTRLGGDVSTKPSNSGALASFAQNADMPNIQSYAAPTGNPYKDQVNLANSRSNKTITIYQSHKTDMVINGADSPRLTAQAVQRQQDAVNTQMARNARSVIT